METRETLAPARYGRNLSDGRVRCDLCPHHCLLRDGERGICHVRAARGGRLETAAFGRIGGLSADPIEKKPLYHMLPGTRTLSFGAIGCNLSCAFCQNASISRPRDERGLRLAARPEDIAGAAVRAGCPSVSFTYNEPIVSFEFTLATAAACRERGLRTIAVTAGYIEREPAREFFGLMDAANVDLKAFSEGFYRRFCGARLAPVLRALERIHEHSRCHVELTTLLIPGANDGDEAIRRMTRWAASRLGPDTPWHFTAFFPAHRLTDRPPTPPDTLRRAREIALSEGIRYAYTGNLSDDEGQSTWCPGCGDRLVERSGYRTRVLGLSPEGACARCGQAIPGLWRREPGGAERGTERH